MISLRGVAVHNLKRVNLDIPRGKLIAFCGLSGSGKTSLALDTLYAEGQRRYIESFSAYTRQFLERMEKPAAEKITGIPPAIAVTHKSSNRSSRSTVGTAIEVNDHLRLLLARIGTVVCETCGHVVVQETPETVARTLLDLPVDTRYLVAFEAGVGGREVGRRESGVGSEGDAVGSDCGRRLAAELTGLREDGFVRVVVNELTVNLQDTSAVEDALRNAGDGDAGDGDVDAPVYVIVDRLMAGGATPQRLRESIETAFAKGGKAIVLIDSPERPVGMAVGDGDPRRANGAAVQLDGRTWWRLAFSRDMTCDNCGREYPPPEPRLYSFNSPLGACPTCEGFGNMVDVDMDLVVPDPHKSIREGAVAPWNTPAYAHELKELIELAPSVLLPLDVPFRDLTDEQRAIICDGSPAHNFGGLRGFFAWLERRKYKMHLRVFLSRWRSYRPCPDCHGGRLRPEALATRLGGLNMAEISALKVRDALKLFRELKLSDYKRQVGRMMLDQVQSRLGYLEAVGLGYLTLDRTLRTLSGGESQRVSLTGALGSSLVNMLYVLDEPSVGLHPADIDRLIRAVVSLRDRGNSVLVVEHEESMLRAADQLIEVGPGAGERGGEIVFQGTVTEMQECRRSVTGDFLAGRRGLTGSRERRKPKHGAVRVTGAKGNNLKNISVEFPLGLLCLVTGVSGSGKSTLVQDTLYPALRRRMRLESPRSEAFDDVFGDGQIDDVVLVDQDPIGRSPRSNPVTYIKAFDEIRNIFADTLEARTRNYTASHFSFNVDGGRCGHCDGDGFLQIDMQFLADVFMKCPECHGRRYRPEILKVQYRGRSIADVLEMTVREAFTFFRGCPKAQARLKRLIDVGLDYLRLGQPANTLSGGEAQRLKLAGYMSAAKRARTLFVLDEPTTGLHFSDVTQLLDCFEALLAVGHSLIVVEHNLQMMKAADYIIDLGPGAADEGGEVVAHGTPEFLATQPQSATGRFLAEAFAKEAAMLDS